MRAIIITGGSVSDYGFYKELFKDDDIIICADGGIRHLNEFKVSADYFLGDFDSCDFEKESKSKYIKNAEIIRFKCEKDETDTEIALNLAIEKNCDEIVMIGAIGTRFDHTLSNVFLLKKALLNGIDAQIIDEHNKIRLTDKPISLEYEKNAYLSLIALEKTEGLTLKNLKYPLDNYTLETGTSRGISNEFTEKNAEISFKKGLLVVMITRD